MLYVSFYIWTIGYASWHNFNYRKGRNLILLNYFLSYRKNYLFIIKMYLRFVKHWQKIRVAKKNSRFLLSLGEGDNQNNTTFADVINIHNKFLNDERVHIDEN